MIEELSESEASYFLGEKVVEMADRLRPVAKAAPGACATYSFELDGVVFQLKLTVRCGD